MNLSDCVAFLMLSFVKTEDNNVSIDYYCEQWIR